ncbi:hypothetical protein C8U37_10251 [Trichococcus patagoniensis]|uniref:Uncharacterized protein n=1 Tax=Trichococcus patagoniensis TaxID=382641 RepID=A0A2T5IQ53_9LACT|nr:hypothetical protein [Trichococcus patagoniensis]PTQ85948.1 hypothetical protein C8U37_10251 [Trichococcus patagoniensis]
MSQKIISSEGEVKTFLSELKEILTDPAFNVDVDLDILLKKKAESPTDPYTTGNTLLELEFDSNDVVNQLMALEVSEYKETVIDDLGSERPPFFAFAKQIKNKDVYVKVKIRDREKHKIFCVSFHFARFPFPKNLPYK